MVKIRAESSRSAPPRSRRFSSFIAGLALATTAAGCAAATPNADESGHSGRWSWQLAGTSSLTQKISTLPGGTYTLAPWVKADTAGAQLRATGFGGTDVTLALPRATAWTRVSLSGIAVSNASAP